MFIDARTVAKGTTVKTDVCIVGGGAAGITLAREFIGRSVNVCLLESGGFQLDVDTQTLYRGQSVGFPYLPLEATRLRFLGGTTNHWGGACRPLDDIDFRKRDWVPHSGWPFGLQHMVPYYERAHQTLKLGPFRYSAEDWTRPDLPCARFDGTTLRSAVLQQSPPVRFGIVYRDALQRAVNVRTYLNANVLEIETGASGREVQRLRASSLAGNQFYVSARYYVLAAGGIETARLLLLSDKVNHNGLGNSSGLVGRYFMDHPIAGWGKVGSIAPLNLPLRFYGDRVKGTRVLNGARKEATIWGFVTPTAQTLERHKLLNFGIAIRRPPTPDADGVESARYFRYAIQQREWPEELWTHVRNVIADLDDIAVHGARKLTDTDPPTDKVEIMYWSEQQPNPSSRVYLSRERDFFGQQRVVLDWRLSDADKRNLHMAMRILAIEIGKANIGRLHVEPAALSDQLEPLLEGSFHHMGTTRMHNDPKQGVVNANCRLHDVANLYIASSAVFPAVGHANCTVTIVALATRLADHLKQQLRV